jgi:gliding motility-associated-like protein
MKPSNFCSFLLFTQLLVSFEQNTTAQCTSYWSVTKDTTVCYGTNSGTLLLAGFTGTVYKWEWALSPSVNPNDWNTVNNTTNTQNFSNLTNTTYFRAFIKDGACIAGYTSIATITADQLSLGGNIIKDTIVCSNNNNGSISIAGNRGNIINWQYSDNEGSDWYDISNANASQSFNNLITTRYYRVQVKNGVCPAVYSATGKITVNPTPVVDFNVNDVCDGSMATFNNLSTVLSGSLTYNWDFGDDTQSKIKNPTKLFLNPGQYDVVLTANSDKNCRKSITKSLTMHVNPTANMEYDNVCLEYPVVFFNRSVIAAAENLSYTWKFGDGAVSILPNPDHYYRSPGIYTIQLTVSSNESNCKDSITRLVQVYPLPKAYAGSDTSVSQGFPAQLSATGGLKYGWMPLEGLSDTEIANPLATPSQTTNFIVRVEDANGCVDKDTVLVTVLEDYKVIPKNIITPDGNGENDYWIIDNILNYGTCKVRVYNRWGNEVYACNAYQNDWSGTSSHGDILPNGTYFYVITFENSDNIYKGALTILRNK